MNALNTPDKFRTEYVHLELHTLQVVVNFMQNTD